MNNYSLNLVNFNYPLPYVKPEYIFPPYLALMLEKVRYQNLNQYYYQQVRREQFRPQKLIEKQFRFNTDKIFTIQRNSRVIKKKVKISKKDIIKKNSNKIFPLCNYEFLELERQPLLNPNAIFILPNSLILPISGTLKTFFNAQLSIICTEKYISNLTVNSSSGTIELKLKNKIEKSNDNQLLKLNEILSNSDAPYATQLRDTLKKIEDLKAITQELNFNQIPQYIKNCKAVNSSQIIFENQTKNNDVIFTFIYSINKQLDLKAIQLNNTAVLFIESILENNYELFCKEDYFEFIHKMLELAYFGSKQLPRDKKRLQCFLKGNDKKEITFVLEFENYVVSNTKSKQLILTAKLKAINDSKLNKTLSSFLKNKNYIEQFILKIEALWEKQKNTTIKNKDISDLFQIQSLNCCKTIKNV